MCPSRVAMGLPVYLPYPNILAPAWVHDREPTLVSHYREQRANVILKQNHGCILLIYFIQRIQKRSDTSSPKEKGFRFTFYRKSNKLLTLSFALASESQNLASFVAQFPDLYFKKWVGLPLCSTPSYLALKLQRGKRKKRKCHDCVCLQGKNTTMNSIQKKKKPRILISFYV